MPHQETSAAVARILSNLAKQHHAAEPDSFPASVIANGINANKITLPGEDSLEKRTLERELNSLATRIQILEAKATNGTNSLPITPNEPLASAFPVQPPASPRPSSSQAARQRSASWVNNLLSRNNTPPQLTQLTPEQILALREWYADNQAQMQSQREVVEEVRSKLEYHQSATVDLVQNSSYVQQLQREVEKNVQINQTYSKVLREIGTIITAVANGDLSKKVLIHATEKDPEIAKFKHTINKMVDQLQEFASQVTQLAKEVGTEGRLGGQAVVPGVAGIWADLTENGMYH